MVTPQPPTGPNAAQGAAIAPRARDYPSFMYAAKGWLATHERDMYQGPTTNVLTTSGRLAIKRERLKPKPEGGHPRSGT